MKANKIIVWIIGLGLLTSILYAMSSENMMVEDQVINSAGEMSSGVNVDLSDSIGESAIGQMTSENLAIQAGFYKDYYVEVPTPTVTPTSTVTPIATITSTPILQFGGELIDEHYIYPAPHPIRGSHANIYYHLAEAADVVEIKVYTTTNRLVISKHWENVPAGKNYWQWHVANLANGAYLMLVKAKRGNKKSRVIKKIAIIK